MPLPSLATFFFPPCSLHAPWRPRVSSPLAVAEVPLPPLLYQALTSPCRPPSQICCVPHGDAVSGAWFPSSSSVFASDVLSLPPLSPLHPSLLASPSPPLPISLGSRRPLAPPTRSCPRPRPPISTVGTKLSAIRRAWLSCVSRWRAGPRPVVNVPGVLAPLSERHNPSLIPELTPAVAPSALPPSITTFTRLH